MIPGDRQVLPLEYLPTLKIVFFSCRFRDFSRSLSHFPSNDSRLTAAIVLVLIFTFTSKQTAHLQTILSDFIRSTTLSPTILQSDFSFRGDLLHSYIRLLVATWTVHTLVSLTVSRLPQAFFLSANQQKHRKSSRFAFYSSLNIVENSFPAVATTKKPFSSKSRTGVFDCIFRNQKSNHTDSFNI